MKTSLTLLAGVAGALVLASGAASAAVSHASLDRVSQVSGYVDGSEYEIARTMFMSQRSVADVRAEALARREVSGYVDGSEYETAHAMFMSRKTREQVRAELAQRGTFVMAALTLAGGGN